jgi:hypothetical protein
LSAGAAEAGAGEAVAASAKSVDAAAAAIFTAAIHEKAKVAILERKIGARAQANLCQEMKL